MYPAVLTEGQVRECREMGVTLTDAFRLSITKTIICLTVVDTHRVLGAKTTKLAGSPLMRSLEIPISDEGS